MWQFAEAIDGLVDGCRELGTAGHRRQRQLLQPDRRHRDPAHPGGRRARGDRRRDRAGADRLRRDRRRGLAARRDPRRAGRVGLGRCRARSPGRAAAGAGSRAREAAGRGCWSRPRDAGCSAAPTIWPTAAWPRRWSSRRCAAGSGRSVSLAERRPVRGAVLREHRTGAGVAAGDRVGELAELAEAASVPLTRLGTTGGDALVVDGQFTVSLDEIRSAWAAPDPQRDGRSRPLTTQTSLTLPSLRSRSHCNGSVATGGGASAGCRYSVRARPA